MKIIPPGMDFHRALTLGYVGRLESDAYRRWVKTLPCVCCGMPGDDPHHPHGAGFKGMGTKVPDWWCFSMTRNCHDNLHHNVAAWEELHGSQHMHALMTLTQAIHEGRLRFEAK